MHAFEFVSVGTNKYAFERVTLGRWVDVFSPSFSKFTGGGLFCFLRLCFPLPSCVSPSKDEFNITTVKRL